MRRDFADIGLSKGGGQHHKKSAQIILSDTKLPVTSQDRLIVASIARYHRKGLPKNKDYNLASLTRANIKKVKLLAIFLRATDDLDYTHQSNVKSLNFKIGTKRVTVECVAEIEWMLEEQAFNNKKDLFEKTLRKKNWCWYGSSSKNR
jgi:exopolyphosphatase / guanosine-5'-triphosphate,3'-diphosphate pyrophosphatase